MTRVVRDRRELDRRCWYLELSSERKNGGQLGHSCWYSMMLPKMCTKFFAHDLSNSVLGRKLRTDMDVSAPFAAGAAIAGLWIPTQHRIGIRHIDGKNGI